MKYLHLIWASLFRRKVRTILTLQSIVAAFLLFGLLDSVRSTFANAGQSVRGIDRLFSISKVSGVDLPISMEADIQAVPGVTKTTYGSALGGTYQHPTNFVPIEAQAENVFDLYPEARVSRAALEAYRGQRTAALVRADFAQKYRWKPGDRLAFQTSIPQRDGSSTWTFDVVGIYDLPEPKVVLPAVMIHWSFFDEMRQSGGGGVGWFNAIVADASQVDYVAQAIDALTANSSHETVTRSENAFFSSLVRQFADIGLIVTAIMGAVFFTLVLLTGNAMAQAARERTAEMAILQAIGFTGHRVMGLLLSESLLLLLLGSALGLTFTVVTIGIMRARLESVLPMPLVVGNIWLPGLAIAACVGLLVGVIPARRCLRLRIVEALSKA